MGTSTSVNQFAAKFTKGARAVEGAQRDGVNEAALIGKEIFLANLPARTMRNVGRGAKLGARFNAATSTSNPSALLYYTGPAHLLNNPIRPHQILPRGATRTAGGRARRGAKALVIGGNVVAYANHPGTSGKHFFEKAMPQVAKAAPKAIADGQHRALMRVFG